MSINLDPQVNHGQKPVVVPEVTPAPQSDSAPESFAEVALRLGGASADEAKRTGVIDSADDQVEDLFADVTRMLQQEWQSAGLQVQATVQPDGLELHADRQMVEQILINLLNNAQDAVADRAQAEVVISSTVNKRGHVIIEVSDNGCGIDEEIGERVFIPFFTTRREGSGIGLALSRQMMVAHGGGITYANNPDQGTRFTLVF